MCGIFGYSTNNLKLEIDIYRSLESIKHRGPDDSDQIFFENSFSKVALGHNRLSIIDTSFDGRQPMSTHDNRYTLVFNGEIYNYKDLRVLLESDGCIFKTKICFILDSSLTLNLLTRAAEAFFL